MNQYVPTIAGLKLLSVNEQRLSRLTSRLLITMVRTERTFTDSDALISSAKKQEAKNYESLDNFHEKYFNSKK